MIAGEEQMPGAKKMNTSSDKQQGHSIFSFFRQIINLPAGHYRVVNGKILPAINTMKSTVLKISAFFLSLIIGGIFLYFTMGKPSALNMIPFAIYEVINLGGNFETSFIIIFDIVTALLLSLISYKIMKAVLNRS